MKTLLTIMMLLGSVSAYSSDAKDIYVTNVVVTEVVGGVYNAYKNGEFEREVEVVTERVDDDKHTWFTWLYQTTDDVTYHKPGEVAHLTIGE